uniref:Uncharacterized protein n=1 Tax=uncultured bacterium contig00021 TaxID=1181511 RepID=A0A806KHQ0_9BACT|nr:hypothetical protein [uncultured bacterium contig00021]
MFARKMLRIFPYRKQKNVVNFCALNESCTGMPEILET